MWKLPKTNSGLAKKLKEAHDLINKAKFQLAQDKRYELASELRKFERPLKTGGINKHHGIWTDRSDALKKIKEIKAKVK
jgi:hypothetical protein